MQPAPTWAATCITSFSTTNVSGQYLNIPLHYTKAKQKIPVFPVSWSQKIGRWCFFLNVALQYSCYKTTSVSQRSVLLFVCFYRVYQSYIIEDLALCSLIIIVILLLSLEVRL